MHRRHVDAPIRDDGAARRAVVAVAAGLGVLGLGMIVVRDGAVTGAEAAAFHAVNHLPDALDVVAWPFQQLGALAVGPLVAVVALLLRRPRLAVAALAATALKLLAERAVKALVTRERPGTSIGPDVHARGDVHVAGESFVSGHAVLVAALAAIVAPYLPRRWRLVPWILVGGVMVGRVYVGAHLPLDVVCGASLGVAIGGTVRLATGVAHRPHVPPSSPPTRSPSEEVVR